MRCFGVIPHDRTGGKDPMKGPFENEPRFWTSPRIATTQVQVEDGHVFFPAPAYEGHCPAWNDYQGQCQRRVQVVPLHEMIYGCWDVSDQIGRIANNREDEDHSIQSIERAISGWNPFCRLMVRLWNRYSFDNRHYERTLVSRHVFRQYVIFFCYRKSLPSLIPTRRRWKSLKFWETPAMLQVRQVTKSSSGSRAPPSDPKMSWNPDRKEWPRLESLHLVAIADGCSSFLTDRRGVKCPRQFHSFGIEKDGSRL